MSMSIRQQAEFEKLKQRVEELERTVQTLLSEREQNAVIEGNRKPGRKKENGAQAHQG